MQKKGGGISVSIADNLWQNLFDAWKKHLTAGISAPSAPQAENKPAFDLLDLRQAIQRLTDTFDIPKIYSRPILFAAKKALSTANG